MASAGAGSGNHVAGELFKMMTGVNLVHVPYRGAGPALVDLLGGQVQVMFASMSSSIAYVRARKLRALAITIATRSPVLPDLPTVAEFVPGGQVCGHQGRLTRQPRHNGFVVHAWLHRAGRGAVRDSTLVAWYRSLRTSHGRGV